MRYYRLTWQALLLASCLTHCLSHCRPRPAEHTPAPQLDRRTYLQSMMGTRFTITLYAEDQAMADAAAKAAFQYAAEINSACSDYDATSELMKLNAAAPNQPVPVSHHLFDVLRHGLELAQQSGGAYDPTLGHHAQNWRVARTSGRLPSPEQISQAKAASGWSHLVVDAATHSVTKRIPEMRLDLGGIAKGYAADGMLNILNNHGITRASITAGGEVRLGEPPPGKLGWQVRLKTLDAQHQLSPATLSLANCGISTSGDLHQSITIGGQSYSHIVNPVTGLGLTARVSATIIADHATLSDALATAYCVNPHLSIPQARSLVIIAQPDGTLTSISSENGSAPSHQTGAD